MSLIRAIPDLKDQGDCTGPPRRVEMATGISGD